jgi:uncharacterized protein (DUF1330 family)
MNRIAFVLPLLASLLISTGFAQETAESAEHAPGEIDALKAAWALEPQGLDADIAKMNAQWDAVEAQLADAAHIKIRAGKVSRWSVGQQCLHILKVANLIGSQLPGLLDSDAPAATGASPMKAQALARGFPRGIAQAPPGLGVHYPPKLDEIHAELARTREIWDALIARKDEIPASTATFPHPVFGPMGAAEWLRFTTVHTAHHLKIVDDILADHAARTADASPPSPSPRAESAPAESRRPAATAPVYVVALIEIHDRETYRKYEAGFLPVFMRHEGEILAVDENVTPAEGEWPWTRTVLLKFPDEAALQRWYASPEYQAILPHRLKAANASIAVVKGFGAPARAAADKDAEQ